MLFSIFMCARNAEDTLERAIYSVSCQICMDWELLIVDNGSSDRTWEIIEKAMEKDSRIKGMHLEEGVGWAKGASICLEKAQGEYMVFLAADDFLFGVGSLSAVERTIRENAPDIVWTGYAEIQTAGKAYQIGGGNIPEYKVYAGGDKINEIMELMQNTYYNSFFHYVRIELLRENGINFYEPFYADSEGMTEAMCVSEKSVVLNEAVYALTLNTSQTRGATTWKPNVAQWQSIKRAVCEKGIYDRNKLGYIAFRIFNNNMVMLENICGNGPVRNKEMNPIEKTALERFLYLEEALETPEFTEMFYYAGKERYAQRIFTAAKNVYSQCLKEGVTKEEIAGQAKWLDRLLLGLCEYMGNGLENRTFFDKQCFENVEYALCHQDNKGIFGYELLREMIPFVRDDIFDIWNRISAKYVERLYEEMYHLLFLAVEIKKRQRTQEVLTLVKESMEIFEQIKENIPEERKLEVVEDMKMILNVL